MKSSPILVFDGDLPMAWNAFDMNRDMTKTVTEIRSEEIAEAEAEGRTAAPPYGTNVVALPEMREGRVAAVLAKIAGRIARPGSILSGYNSPEAAHAACWTHLEYYRTLAAGGWGRILTNSTDLFSHFQAWEAGKTDRIGFVLGMEGADPILWPDQVYEWWHAGVRVVSLTHYGVSTYASGSGSTGGVTAQGRALLRAMERCGMILDLTHTSDESFWQALNLFSGPVIASHQNCRALVPRQRQFSDEMLQAILRRGAVIGVSLDAWMLVPEWDLNQKDRSRVSLTRVADQIEHICQVAGNSQQVGVGSDLDGGQGYEGFPSELDTIADLQLLPELLARRGFSETEIAGIMYQNWLRFYRSHLPLQ